MENKFVNKFYSDEKMAKEVVFKILMKPYFVFSGIFIAAMLIIFSVIMIVRQYFDIGIFAILAIYMIFVFAIMPNVYISRIKKSDKIMYGDNIPQAVVTVTDDEITIDEGENHILHKMSNVKALICKKKIWGLKLKVGGVVMLSPDGFETGTPDEFKAFISSKGIKMK